MSTDVEIGNLALSLIGDEATLISLSPPEGSVQADLVASFYPIARDTLLTSHDWGFNTTRANGQPVDAPLSGWQYAYARPSLALRIISVIPLGSTDDYISPPPAGTITLADGSYASPVNGGGLDQEQPFAQEIDATGREIIVTNQSTAIIRYTVKITDTTKFSPLFVTALSYLLASYIAGPIIKGDKGRKTAADMMQMSATYSNLAVAIDASQQKIEPEHQVSWITGR